ncbi:MAG: response regulator transcription factor [Actinomycetota bacterium]|nr:response regulator transcription factor [Actinomycetota bacterium]
MEPRVLIAEDDHDLRGVLIRGLREEGFETEGVASGADLLRRGTDAVPDIFVVDIGLPDADGRDVCQALRARGIDAPVMFLTARDALPDRLAGFSAGGDDYLTKPFAFGELVARIRALVRRGGTDLAVEVGPLRLDPVGHSASIGDETVSLTPTEFRLLAHLAAHPGNAVRRKHLVDAAWPYGAIVRDNTLDVYVARLRRKLKALPEAPSINTVHGVGYAIG